MIQHGTHGETSKVRKVCLREPALADPDECFSCVREQTYVQKLKSLSKVVRVKVERNEPPVDALRLKAKNKFPFPEGSGNLRRPFLGLFVTRVGFRPSDLLPPI